MSQSERAKLISEIDKCIGHYKRSKQFSIEGVFKIVEKNELKTLLKFSQQLKENLILLEDHDFLRYRVLENDQLEENIRQVLKLINKKIKIESPKESIDLRKFNSRPTNKELDELIDSLFNLYIKFVLKKEITKKIDSRLIKSYAVDMSKFTSLILAQSLQCDTVKFSSKTDNLNYNSSEWSRLSKRSLKYLRHILK